MGMIGAAIKATGMRGGGLLAGGAIGLGRSVWGEKI
jgi:hypothetical protein